MQGTASGGTHATKIYRKTDPEESPTLGEPYRHPDLKGRIGNGQLTHLVGTNRYRTKVTMVVTGSQSQVDKSPGKEIRRSREMAPRANPKAMVPKRKGNILNQVQRATEEDAISPNRAKQEVPGHTSSQAAK